MDVLIAFSDSFFNCVSRLSFVVVCSFFFRSAQTNQWMKRKCVELQREAKVTNKRRKKSIAWEDARGFTYWTTQESVSRLREKLSVSCITARSDLRWLWEWRKWLTITDAVWLDARLSLQLRILHPKVKVKPSLTILSCDQVSTFQRFNDLMVLLIKLEVLSKTKIFLLTSSSLPFKGISWILFINHWINMWRLCKNRPANEAAAIKQETSFLQALDCGLRVHHHDKNRMRKLCSSKTKKLRTT